MPVGYTNAPAGQAPLVTPGAGTLTIGFSSTNSGTIAGTLTQNIVANGNLLATSSALVEPMGTNLITSYTGAMPTTPYSIVLSVNP